MLPASFLMGATRGSPSACQPLLPIVAPGVRWELLQTHHFGLCSLAIFLLKPHGLPWRGETAGKMLMRLRSNMGQSSLPGWGASGAAHLQGMRRPGLAASLVTSPSSFFPWATPSRPPCTARTHLLPALHLPTLCSSPSCPLPCKHPLFLLSSPLPTRYLLSACIQPLHLCFLLLSVCSRSCWLHHQPTCFPIS